MTTHTPSVLLDLAATQSGFDLSQPEPPPWLGYASTQSPLRVWLRAAPDGALVVALSMRNVALALASAALGAPATGDLPAGAVHAVAVADRSALHRLLRRAWEFARTLPDELLHTFAKRTATLPRTTEAERLVVQRVGQDVFRGGLLEYWQGRCAVTGLAVRGLLRASHIKPWADCETDAERLDVFNGLLLAPHLDAAFDGGLLTFDDDGAVVLSWVLDAEARALLAIDAAMRLKHLEDGHRRYLAYHRQVVFQGELLRLP
jgi:putative restriction endonuclease